MTNVLQIIAPTYLGGAENVVFSISRLIDPFHFKLYFCIFLNPKRDKNAFLEKLNGFQSDVSIIYLDRPWLDFTYLFRLLRIVRKEKIDIIHTHGYMPTFFALPASKMTCTPIITTVHGWTASTRSLKIYECIDRKLLKYFDMTIPVSQQLQHTLIQNHVSLSKITLLHNIIWPSLSASPQHVTELRQKFHIDPETLTLGAIGRLSKEKGHLYLLKAIPAIRKKFPNIKLLIIGDGDQRSELETYALRHELNNEVIFCGFQDDIGPFYSLLDAYVLPSLTEGLPLTLLEAMHFEKPIVATNVGGIQEVLQQGLTGELVPPGDSSALAISILRLFQNKDYARKLAKNAQINFARNFDPTTWIRTIEGIYRKVAV